MDIKTTKKEYEKDIVILNYLKREIKDRDEKVIKSYLEIAIKTKQIELKQLEKIMMDCK